MNTERFEKNFLHIFKLPFMDQMHDYPGATSNVRYYHRLKARSIDYFLAHSITRESIVFDAGGGRGPHARMSAMYNAKKVFLFEYDEEELSIAQNYLTDFPEIVCKQVDLTQIPLEENAVDLIVCSEVLEHIPDNLTASQELFRVPKPGGKMIFSMPNKQSLFYKRVQKNYRHLLKDVPDDPRHPHWELKRHVSHTPRNIELLLTSSGFTLVRRHGVNIFPLPESLRTFLITYLPFIMKTFIIVQNFLGKIIPQYGSFYFLIAAKEKGL